MWEIGESELPFSVLNFPGSNSDWPKTRPQKVVIAPSLAASWMDGGREGRPPPDGVLSRADGVLSREDGVLSREDGAGGLHAFHTHSGDASDAGSAMGSRQGHLPGWAS